MVHPALARAGSGPQYMSQVRESMKAEQKRKPAAEAEAKKAEAAAQKSQANAPGKPVGTQISFFEVSPTLGSMSIGDKQTFSIGSNLSFRVTPNFPAYFEPSVYLSFINGLNDQNGTVWHIDGGMRLDFAINDSAVVPFVKGALGPSLTTSSNITLKNGEELPDSYINAFLGGGVKLLLSEHVAPRLDVGTTLQNGSFGLYLLASAVLPL